MRLSEVVRDERYQGHMAGALDSSCQLPLVFCTGACNTARQHLALIIQITRKLVSVLVIDVFNTCARKLTLPFLTTLAGRCDIPDKRLSLVSLF